MPGATILESGTDGFDAATKGAIRSAHEGSFVQIAPADLITHWQQELEDATGFSLQSIFDVTVVDLEQRIDITLGEEGFNIDVVELGTNWLSYAILDNKSGVAAAFGDGYDPGFPLAGKVQDLSYLDLFGDVDTGNRDFFIEYSGLIQAESAGAHLFRYSSVGGFVLQIDGDTVLEVPPGGSGQVEIAIPVGLHRIQIVAEHDPLAATSPTDRTDDDLQITVKAPGGSGFDSLFDLVRTEPEGLIEVALTATVNGGAAETVSFLVTDTADIKAIAQGYLQGLGATDSDAITLQMDTTAEVSVGAAGWYHFGAQTGSTTAGLQIDGTTTADAPGETARSFLTAGAHAVAATAYFDGWEALEASDTTITWRGEETGGRTLTLLGDPPALADGFIQTLNDALEGAEAFVDDLGILPLDLGILEASPTLAFSLGLDAELGWNFDLPGLGRTSTEQPVTFALNVSHGLAGGQAVINAFVSDMAFLAPTTRNSVLEVGGFQMNAGFSLPETQLGDVGFYVASSPVAEELVDEVFGADNPLARLNSSLDGLFRFKFQLDKTLSLEEIIGIAETVADASGAARDPDKGFDLAGFLGGLYSGEIDAAKTIGDLVGHVADADWEAAFNLFFRVAGLAPDPVAEAPGGETDPVTALVVKTAEGVTVEVEAPDLLALVRTAAFKGAATPAEGGEGGGDPAPADPPASGEKTVSFVDSVLGTVEVTLSSIREAAESSGLVEAFAALNTLFEQGFEFMTGLRLELDLPIGEVTEHRGFDGTLAEDDPGTSRDAPAQIVTTTTSSIVSLTADIEEIYNHAATDAIDAMLEKPGLSALERKQLINAKIMAALQPMMTEIIEEGASASITVSPGPFIHAVTDLFLGLIDGISGGVDWLADTLGVDLDFATNLADDPNIDAMFKDPALMEAGIRQALAPLGDVIKGIPDVIDQAIRAVGTLFVDYSVTKPNPAHEEMLVTRGMEVIRAVGNMEFLLAQVAADGIDPATLRLERDVFDASRFVFVGTDTATGLADVVDGVIISQADLEQQFHNYGLDLPDLTLPDPQLQSWVTSIPDFFREDLAGAVSTVREFLADALNDIVAWADLGIAGDWRPELTALLGTFGFEFDYDDDQDSYGLRFDDSPLSFVGDIESGITDFADILDDLADAVKDFFTTGIDLNFDDAVNQLIEGFATTIPQMMQGITATADLDLNLWDLELGAALNLTQTTTFNPDAVKVEYSFLGQTIIADYGDAVQFTVPDDLPDDAVPAVTARLIFDGSYDYDYTLAPDFDFNFAMFGFSLQTMLEMGDEVLFEDVLEYALLKTTDDYDPDNALSQYDDALIELDRTAIEEGMAAIFDTLLIAPFRDQLAAANGTTPAIGDGTVSLGTITGVAAGGEEGGFSPVTATAGLDLAPAVLGTDGADALRGRDGPRRYLGGEGRDSVSFLREEEGLSLNLDTGSHTGAAEGSVFSSIEVHYLTEQEDSFAAGTEGVTVEGRGGNDSLQGGAGNDRMLGGDGDDTLFGDEGHDHLTGGAGRDQLDGGAGRDWLSYAGSALAVAVSLVADGAGDQQASGGDAEADEVRGFENVLGSAGNDTLTGDDLANILVGAGGDDSLLGGDGGDQIRGGAGADTMDGGAGRDRLSYALSEAGVTVSLVADAGGWQSASGGDATGDRVRGFESAGGSAHDDRLTGDDLANVLSGGEGDDSILGGDGHDRLAGGAGADTLEGGAGRDSLSYAASEAGVVVSLVADGAGWQSAAGGEAEGDVIRGFEHVTGSAFDDRLTGDAAANTLDGGAGNDTLSGGSGGDILTGDEGADLFVFDTGSGRDRVTDFGADDRLSLSAGLWTGDRSAAQVLADFGTEVGGDVELRFNAQDVLRLENASLAALNGMLDQFLLV